MRRVRRRPTLAAALISLALSAIMVGPALLPGRALSSADIWWFFTPWTAEVPAGLTQAANSDLQDAAQQFQPLREEVRRQLPDVPLWNPWIAGGRPLLADAQSAVFSPFNLPAWVLPLQTSLAWTALLILWAATFGMYLLARALGMRFAGALMAGIVYGLNLWLVSHLSYPHAAVWALLPWLLWGTERLVRRPDAGSVALLAVLIALQYFGGHPETSFHVLLGTVAFFALRVGLARRRGVRAPLLAMGAALLAGTGLAAVMVVPFAELLFNSADLAERSGDSVDQHQTGALGLAFFLYDYWGRSTEVALPPFPFLFARSWYVGALPLMLAAAALVLRPRAERLWIAGGGLVLVAVIFGVPPFLQIATRLPLLSSGHNDRLILLVLACLALLAGWGLDDLLSRDLLRQRKRAAVIAAAVVLLVPFAWVLARGDIDRWVPREAIEVALELAEPPARDDPAVDDVIRSGTLVLWAVLAGAGLVLILLRVRGLPARWFAALALALVVVDLMRAGVGYNPSIPDEHADQPVTGALSYLAGRGQARFAGVGDVPHNVSALRMRIQDARGYDVPILERYNRLWRREISPEYPDLTTTFASLFLQVPRVDERRLHTLRLLGVTDLLVPPDGAAAQPEGLDTPGLTPVYEGDDARVLRVEGALPRTFVAGAQQPVDGGDAALDAVTDPELDARNVAVTERRLPGVPETSSGPAGTARIVSYEPDRVTIDARLDRRGVVVLSDNWFPGWKATVDGRPADIERVDYVLRGTVVDRGRHRIEYRYEPASWRIGWIMSLLCLLGLAGALVWSRRRPAASPQ